MLNPEQLRNIIVAPALEKIGLATSAAINLVCGTALVETNLEFIAQIPNPIALGFWQIEAPTYADLLHRLSQRKSLQQQVLDALHMSSFPLSYEYLAGNLYAGCLFCRLKYYFIPEELPEAENIIALADFWGKYYNTKNRTIDKSRFIARYATAYPSS